MLEWFGFNESDEKLRLLYKAIRNLTPQEERIYRLLLIDGFTGHYSMDISDYYEKYDILVLPLILYLTHRM